MPWRKPKTLLPTSLFVNRPKADYNLYMAVTGLGVFGVRKELADQIRMALSKTFTTSRVINIK